MSSGIDERTLSAPVPDGEPVRPSILLIDDSPEIRDHVRRLLADRYDVVVAASGEEGLARVRERRPDLVLTDAIMPGLSGYELVRELRADPQIAAVPIVLFSARAGEDSRVEGLEAGADDYLIKPFSARELLTRVKTHLEMARVRREAAQRERELQAEKLAAQEHLGAILAGLNDAFLTVDDEGRCTYLNPRAAELLGLAADQVVGRAVGELPRAGNPAAGEGDGQTAALASDLARAIAGEPGRRSEHYYPRLGRWFEHRVQPAPRGFSIFVSDITERRLAEAALVQAKEAAESANLAKDQFLATLSHELRTPLTPVLAMTSALEQDARLPAEVRDQLTMVRRNVELEARLIDDLLDLTRVTRGKLEIQRQKIDLRPALEHAMQTCCTAEVEGGRLRLDLDLAAESHQVRADAPRLIQVFWNLFNNAIKFMPEGGTIRVRTRNEDGMLVVEISDTGIGIDAELLPRIFDAFEQGQPGITRRFGGLGLGLAISKAIVELHGGAIVAASAGSRQGSTFTLRLPLAAAAENAVGEPGSAGSAGAAISPVSAGPGASLSAAADASSGVSAGSAASAASAASASSIGSTAFTGSEVSAGKTAGTGQASPGDSSSPAAADTQAPRLHILLVEDHVDTAGAMADLLGRLGHRVTVAGSVEAALASARDFAAPGDGSREPIGLVLSDLGLPDGSGLDLMRELAASYQLRGIALSGYGMEEDVRKSHAAGFVRHLTKPVNLRDLEAVILETARE